MKKSFTPSKKQNRTILHSDCNSFYASVECLYNPELRGKPVAVGGSAENRHGIILTKNQLAKQFGVQTGEPIWRARQKCPELVTVPPHFSLYTRFSNMAKEIYAEYTDRVESFGLDEAWLDVTESRSLFGSGEKIAAEIKQRIKKELGITVSIGVSFNKVFAKFGSDYKKPDAVTLISLENFREIVWNSPASDLLYVGSATKRKLSSMGIYTIGEIAVTPIEQLRLCFGKTGELLWGFANGYDTSPVARLHSGQNIKSIGNSVTAPRDLNSFEDAAIVMCTLADSVCRRLREQGFKAKTVSIRIRDKMLCSFTRQTALKEHTNITKIITEQSLSLFKENYRWHMPVRSIGISVSDLIPANTPSQISLLPEEQKKQKLEALDKTADRLKQRFGTYSLIPAALLKDRALSHFDPYEEHTIHPVGFF